MAVWVHSMNGVPWTAAKMRQAVKVLREGASVTFAFDADPLERLAQLDAKVLSARPDLVLHVWSTSAKRRLSDEQMAALVALPHLRHLKVSGVKGAPFEALGRASKLETLGLGLDGRLDLAFVTQLPALRSVKLSAKVDDLSPLAKVKRLETLALAGTLGDLSPLADCMRLASLRFGSSMIRSLDSLPPKLTALALDTATVTGTLDGIAAAAGLTDLSLTNNRNLRRVDFLRTLARLRRLRLDQPHVVTLPDLSMLGKLETIECGGMKAWTNPEVLQTLPRVRKIVLKEINSKLPADRFFFLADPTKLRALQEVDVRFLDFAKKRRAALRAHFVATNRAKLLTT